MADDKKIIFSMVGVSKVFPPQKQVLKNIYLSFFYGAKIGIIGLNGSGKSTLMNIIGCLDQATKGTFFLDGEDISKCSENEMSDIRLNKIGFVFQSFHLLPKQSALANVEMPLNYARVPKKERRERARKALERVGLADRVDFKPNQLSGGQMQRVAIARALAKNPKLLLCDEPTGALDYNTGKAILKLLQDTCRNNGMTVIVITHNLALTAMGDKVIKIKNGRVDSIHVNEHPEPVERIEW